MKTTTTFDSIKRVIRGERLKGGDPLVTMVRRLEERAKHLSGAAYTLPPTKTATKLIDAADELTLRVRKLRVRMVEGAGVKALARILFSTELLLDAKEAKS